MVSREQFIEIVDTITIRVIQHDLVQAVLNARLLRVTRGLFAEDSKTITEGIVRKVIE